MSDMAAQGCILTRELKTKSAMKMSQVSQASHCNNVGAIYLWQKTTF